MRFPVAFLLCMFCASALRAAEGGAAPDVSRRIVAEDKPELAFLRSDRRVTEYLKELPEDHKLQPVVTFTWSDDEAKPIPCLVSLTPVDPDGKPDGEARYYDDTFVRRVVPWQHGLKEGVEKECVWPDGGRGGSVTVSETPWRNGKVHGVKKLYHPENGKVSMEVPYADGLRQGVAKSYDLPGRLEKVVPYKDDKADGEVIEYWTATGKPRKIVPFRNGVAQGVVREYHDNGNLKNELPVENDLFQGIEKQYDEKGTLVMTRYWLRDELVSKEQYEQAAK
jgi:antitoxin component YwqK of YwqJK toxin-antitoxin module